MMREDDKNTPLSVLECTDDVNQVAVQAIYEHLGDHVFQYNSQCLRLDSGELHALTHENTTIVIYPAPYEHFSHIEFRVEQGETYVLKFKAGTQFEEQFQDQLYYVEGYPVRIEPRPSVDIYECLLEYHAQLGSQALEAYLKDRACN